MSSFEEDLAPLDAASDAEDLGRSYGMILNSQDWQPDAETELVNPEVPAEEPASPLRIIEAMLFVGGAPLTAVRACEAVRGLTEAQFHQAIAALNADYRKQGRPYSVQALAQGYVLSLRPRYRFVTEKLFGGTREVRLSPAAIDVLALVAYRQPATKQEIDSVRGMESGGLLRQLVRRGLIAVAQRADASRKEVAYGTTERFLKLFGLSSLDDLPQTQELQRL
ncbi:MAG: SMC-Scp complex subunit ScpB [Gemmataceae bacterium]